MQQLRGVLLVTKPLLSLRTFYTELAAAEALRTCRAACTTGHTTAWCAVCQRPLLDVLHSPTEPSNLPALRSASAYQRQSDQAHARSFASQSASRLQQTVNRAKRAAQAHKGSKATDVPAQQDPSSNTAVDSIPQSETGIQASQSRPTTLQVSLAAFTVHSCHVMRQA